MRIEGSVLSVSWIPSEAIEGLNKLPFESGVFHYDDPPPDVIPDVPDLEKLRAGDRFRFANRLAAWIDVENGRVVGHGYSGRGHMGATTLRLGERGTSVPGLSLPDIRREPEVRETSVRFVQTVGGRTGVPAPRRVSRPPFVQYRAPVVWTTLALTLHADGRVEHEVLGASPFPRHWIYDERGKLVQKAGLLEFKEWWRQAFGDQTPWGDVDSPVLVTAVETALERELAGVVMRGGRQPEIRAVKQGTTLVEQGQPGDEVFLLLDGVFALEVDGEVLAEVGPGAIVGERAVLEGGRRTATLRALTPCKVAAVGADALEPDALAKVSEGHRREERR